jgi:predicted DNA-binding WGR domain protein
MQMPVRKINTIGMSLPDIIAAINKKYNKKAVYFGSENLDNKDAVTLASEERSGKRSEKITKVWGRDCLATQRIFTWQKADRYYKVYIQPTLFAEISVTQVWGKCGTKLGNSKEYFVLSMEQAYKLLINTHERRLKRGYSLNE